MKYKIRCDYDGRVDSAHALQHFEEHCEQRRPVGSCECDAYHAHECVCDIDPSLEGWSSREQAAYFAELNGSPYSENFTSECNREDWR